VNIDAASSSGGSDTVGLVLTIVSIVVVPVLAGLLRAWYRRRNRPRPMPPAPARPVYAPPAPAVPSPAPPRPVGSVLAVDFGTYNTVAAIRRPGQPASVLLFDGMPLLASNVYADGSGELFTGRDAAHLARLDPARYEPNPKRRIDDGMLLLGDREYPVVEVVAAVLRRVVAEARRVGGDVAEVVLTYPAAWGPQRQAILRAAAERAGMPAVRLVAEPVAAAQRYVELGEARWGDGQTLVVFDFGAGTLDVAAVRRDGGRFAVVCYDGLDGVGGLDIDAAIVAHVGAQVTAHDPDVWRRIEAPAGPDDQRARQMLWADARSAKEMLSRASVAPLPVTGYPAGAHLTRDELNRLAGPLVERAVHVTAGVLDAAGTRADRLAGILLVGGSSRLPLVSHLILTRLHVAATVTEQPETIVAIGAAAG
jgi:molecular chaperone DnaK (HSP70)